MGVSARGFYPMPSRLLAVALALLVFSMASAVAGEPPPTDLDRLMARVLEHRDQAWKRFHDYVLDERERVAVTGPGRVPLFGLEREYTWFVQDGFYVRSPVRADGVALSESERRQREAEWLARERRREERAQKKAQDDGAAGAAAKARGVEGAATAEHGGEAASAGGEEDVTRLFRATTEPRFVSEAYFLKFQFEPGNYFLAGRERLGDREVLRIEYYPTNLYREDPEDEDEARVQRQLNKVALVTLWVDPAELQIVKYVFDNVDFGFLPGRWLVRVDGARASMTMGQPVDESWLPLHIQATVGFSTAKGAIDIDYDRQFSGYRRAETSARIRGFAPMDR
jgi:hypothetical protein